eukprot:2484964-Rhodomonas_salina.1
MIRATGNLKALAAAAAPLRLPGLTWANFEDASECLSESSWSLQFQPLAAECRIELRLRADTWADGSLDPPKKLEVTGRLQRSNCRLGPGKPAAELRLARADIRSQLETVTSEFKPEKAVDRVTVTRLGSSLPAGGQCQTVTVGPGRPQAGVAQRCRGRIYRGQYRA